MCKRSWHLLFVLVAVVALTATATWAWFYSTENQGASITTGTILLHGSAGFPLAVTAMLPGESQSKEVTIQNLGSAAADFYVQLIEYDDGTNTNFCIPDRVLNIKIQRLDTPAGTVLESWYDDTICKLYPHEADAIIAKIADDVPAGADRYYRITLTLATSAGNSLQGGGNTDTVHLIATQYNGPAPVPNAPVYPHTPWPIGDPNYGP